MTNQERMERIELPEELDQVILGAVKRGTRKKKQAVWKKAGLGCMGAAAAFAVLVGAGFASPVAARAFEGMPAVGRVFTYLYDLAGYENRYAQVAENARPAQPVGQGGPREEVMGESQAGTGQQETDGQEASGQPDAETVQNAVTATDSGVTITVKEYFCDRQNLYLSMTLESEEPFFEGEAAENTKGSLMLFTGEETLSYEGVDSVSVDNGALSVDGVYLDEHTFVGIARSEWRDVKEENLVIPDELVYTTLIRHLKVYSAQNNPLDLRGEWKLSMEILCQEDAIEILPVEETGEDGSVIREVRLHPYEVQVVTESGKSGSTLTKDWKILLAFDGQGNLLDWAGNIASFGEDGKEVFAFARPENLEGLDLFIVDEVSWMDHWKGNLYGGGMTEPEMVEFLKDKCILHVFVNCIK